MINIEQLKQEVSEVTHELDRKVAMQVIDYLSEKGCLRDEWRPIETAPENSDVFLVCLPRMMNLIIRARYDRIHKQWLSERLSGDRITGVEFFHHGDLWIPIPKPPKGV